MQTLSPTFWPTLKTHFPFFNVTTTLPELGQRVHLQQLYDNLKTKYPLATEKYWLPRTWQTWAWQPIYLCICAYYTLQQPLEATQFDILVADTFTNGFYAKKGLNDCAADSFEAMQSSIVAFAQNQMHLFDELFDHQFTHKLAYQYTMDSILAALGLLLNKNIIDSTEVTNSWTSLFKVLKVSTLGFNADKKEYFLEPALCCQHFRISKDNLCQGCPRLKKNSCGHQKNNEDD